MDGEAAVSLRIHVKLFALLRERAGTGELTMDLPAGATVGEARKRLSDELPTLGPLLERVAFAINHEYVRPEAPLRDGDELALIPPVSGG